MTQNVMFNSTISQSTSERLDFKTKNLGYMTITIYYKLI